MNSPPIDATRWARLKDHVADLAALGAAERSEALRSSTLDEADREWLQKLAQPLIADDPRLQGSHPSAIGLSDFAGMRWQRGDMLGRYRVERLLGRGGMGEVYAARSMQEERIVALKVLRAGLEQHDYARLSDIEQRALRRLDDPRIARFIETFVIEDGGACLVLEWVDGQPLQSYCTARSLGISERLGLFIEICHAVASAHQQLVVHRDLKPGNVLVLPTGQIKLLDFGVAKLLDDGGTLTQTHGNLFTLDYAAPEQVLNEAISTATDIYALGGLLFRLLSDTSPYARTGGSSLIKAVLNEPPQRLADAVLRARGEGRKPVSGSIDGDLDRIIARCMEKDPRSRYGSAPELAADVQAIRTGKPISSGGSSFYRLSKFLRRHRATAAGGVLAFVSLLVAASVSIHEARQTALHAHRADVANHFLLTALDLTDRFSASNTGDLTLGEVLERAVTKARTELVDEPTVRATVLTQLSLALLHRGRTELAQSVTLEAYELRKQDPESTALEKAETAQQLGSLGIEQGHLDAADRYLREALEWLGSSAAENPVQIATLTSLGKLASIRGHAAQSLEWYRKILDLRTRLAGDHRAEVAMDYNNLGTGLYNMARFRDAEAAYASGIDLLRSQFGNTHPRIGYLQFGRASALVQLGRFEEASVLLASADNSLGTADNVRGGQPGGVNSERLRSMIDFLTSNYASARRRLEIAVPQIRISSPVSVAAVVLLQGRVELQAGNPVGAASALAESVRLYDKDGRSLHPQRWLAHGLHGLALTQQGQVAQGDEEIEQAYLHLADGDHSESVELAELALVSGASARRRGDLSTALQRHRVAEAFQHRSGWLGELGRNLVMAEQVLDGLAANADADARSRSRANLERTITRLHDLAPHHPALALLIAQRSAQ